MRTTIELPDDLHAIARQLAHDSGRSMSEVIGELIRRGIGLSPSPEAEAMSERSGLPRISVGRVVTSNDVRSLEDE